MLRSHSLGSLSQTLFSLRIPPPTVRATPFKHFGIRSTKSAMNKNTEQQENSKGTMKSNPGVVKLQQVVHSDSAGGWEKSWEQGLTPWDLGQPTPIILHLHQTGGLPKGRALVPGCGTGYDVVAMACPDRYVVGLDISDKCIKKAIEIILTVQLYYLTKVVKEMVDEVVEVHLLSKNETWIMFKQIVFNVIHIPNIAFSARKIVQTCAGILLLITKVASSLKEKYTVLEWRNAVKKLKLWPQKELEGLQEMYNFLRFCYDDLETEHMKKCLLYGALYPTNRKIYSDYLVECWACQGFLANIDDSVKYQDVRDGGALIVEHLTKASLLERCETNVYVWMDSYIRRVGMHFLSGDLESTFLVKNTSKIALGSVEHWREAKHISMIGCNIKY